eukprot:GHVN01067289.1.p1 GENE.GHVN01067289.1~~GHVN01067289.1.p1  ORF type:complete len:385 (+),score=33.76 GHVN01067289.1:1020-2174(+)
MTVSNGQSSPLSTTDSSGGPVPMSTADSSGNPVRFDTPNGSACLAVNDSEVEERAEGSAARIVHKPSRRGGPSAFKPNKEMSGVFNRQDKDYGKPLPIVYTPEGLMADVLTYETSSGKQGQNCQQLNEALKSLGKELLEGGRVRVAVVFTPHWQANKPNTIKITACVKNEIAKDYKPLPKNVNDFAYEPQGDPALVLKIRDSFTRNGFEVETERKRGLDHGVYVPMKVMFPWSNTSVVQVSLLQDPDPVQHYKIGESLTWLRHDIPGLLFLTVGLTYSNAAGFRLGRCSCLTPRVASKYSEMFEEYVKSILMTGEDAVKQNNDRTMALAKWRNHKASFKCHPAKNSAIYMMPLFVAMGVAKGKPASVAWEGEVGQVNQTIYKWD